MVVKANWGGKYPNLCCGDWSLEVDGIDVSDKIPEGIRFNTMYTYGTYRIWHFEDGLEVFESYEDGLHCDDWIKANKYWLDTITLDITVQKEIFDAINKCDWRRCSCGGCI